MENPFVLEPHVPRHLFCDRLKEMEQMVYYLTHHANVTLVSPRRYGKTGLIYRVFDELKQTRPDIQSYYVDIYSSHNLSGFVALLTEAVMKALKSKSLVDRFLGVLGAIRPVVSYDPYTNSPQATFTFQNDQQKQYTLKSILEFLDKQPHPVVLAIDEFQQIREYDDDSDMEALLRTYIQSLTNVHFVFCGSKKHVIVEMFTDPHRPFYESTQLLSLSPIDHDIYHQFISEKFASGGRKIESGVIDLILDWSYGHTFYTQSLCYHLFMKCKSSIEARDVYSVAHAILSQRTDTFLEQRLLLTRGQWQYMKAVAKEGYLQQPTSSSFLKKYGLGGASASMRILNALIEKEMVLPLVAESGTQYRVYNVFLSRWLELQPM